MDKNKTAQILQFAGILGFVLAFLQLEIGWFMGFFCTGIYFILKKDKQRKFNLIVGVLALLYSFYCLFTQTNLF